MVLGKLQCIECGCGVEQYCKSYDIDAADIKSKQRRMCIRREFKMKRKISFILIAALVISMFTVLISATSYGAVGTLTLSAGSDFKRATTIKDTKAYASESTYYINVTNKTMITSPTAKIVNSNGDTRSYTVTISSTGVFSGSLYSTATVGYNYYMAAKPSSLQIGSDTITAQINVG